MAIKTESLTFDISGEGNLPRVTVLRPVLHNKRGNPLLLFKKLLLGDSEKLPLVLQNNGIIPVQVRGCWGNASATLGASSCPMEEKAWHRLAAILCISSPSPSYLICGNAWHPTYIIFYLITSYCSLIKLDCSLIPFCSLFTLSQ